MALAPTEEIEAAERIEFANSHENNFATIWQESLFDVLSLLPQGLRKRLSHLALDGTSASVLACNAALEPLHAPYSTTIAAPPPRPN